MRIDRATTSVNEPTDVGRTMVPVLDDTSSDTAQLVAGQG